MAKKRSKINTSKWTKVTLRLNEYDLRLLHLAGEKLVTPTDREEGFAPLPNAEIVRRIVFNTLRK